MATPKENDATAPLIRHARPSGIGPQPLFGSPEHALIGKSVKLTMEDGTKLWTTDIRTEFNFNHLDSSLNKLKLHYWQINFLAGDYYATYEPITGNLATDNLTDDQMLGRFQEAWELLAKEKGSEEEALSIMKNLVKDEFSVIGGLKGQQYIKDHHLQTSWLWAKKVSPWEELKQDTEATNQRVKGDKYTKDYPNYLGVLLLNVDHFGEDAHTAYRIGHLAACKQAKDAKDEKGLMLAYAMNAFADHFLEDSFSAGHLRTPRRALQMYKTKEELDRADPYLILQKLKAILDDLKNWNIPDIIEKLPEIAAQLEAMDVPFPDLCANLMHNEDCALGVHAKNKPHPPAKPGLPPLPDEWLCVGDQYLEDTVGHDTLNLAIAAVQTSVDEVYWAYKNRAIPEFKALDYAPRLDAVFDKPAKEALAPLFKVLDPKTSEPATRWGYEEYLFDTISVPKDPRRTEWDTGNYVTPYKQSWLWLAMQIRLLCADYWNYPLLLKGYSSSDYGEYPS